MSKNNKINKNKKYHDNINDIKSNQNNISKVNNIDNKKSIKNQNYVIFDNLSKKNKDSGILNTVTNIKVIKNKCDIKDINEDEEGENSDSNDIDEEEGDSKYTDKEESDLNDLDEDEEECNSKDTDEEEDESDSKNTDEEENDTNETDKNESDNEDIDENKTNVNIKNSIMQLEFINKNKVIVKYSILKYNTVRINNSEIYIKIDDDKTFKPVCFYKSSNIKDLKLKLKEISTDDYIYILYIGVYNNSHIFKIGKSTNILNRISSHIKTYIHKSTKEVPILCFLIKTLYIDDVESSILKHIKKIGLNIEIDFNSSVHKELFKITNKYSLNSIINILTDYVDIYDLVKKDKIDNTFECTICFSQFLTPRRLASHLSNCRKDHKIAMLTEEIMSLKRIIYRLYNEKIHSRRITTIIAKLSIDQEILN